VISQAYFTSREAFTHILKQPPEEATKALYKRNPCALRMLYGLIKGEKRFYQCSLVNI